MKHIENNKILNGVLSLLDEEEKAILYSKIKIENYRAKELIVRAGEKKNYSIYILKGLVRCFKIKDNGDEVTLFVRVENQFLTVLDTVFF